MGESICSSVELGLDWASAIIRVLSPLDWNILRGVSGTFLLAQLVTSAGIIFQRFLCALETNQQLSKARVFPFLLSDQLAHFGESSPPTRVPSLAPLTSHIPLPSSISPQPLACTCGHSRRPGALWRHFSWYLPYSPIVMATALRSAEICRPVSSTS